MFQCCCVNVAIYHPFHDFVEIVEPFRVQEKRNSICLIDSADIQLLQFRRRTSGTLDLNSNHDPVDTRQQIRYPGFLEPAAPNLCVPAAHGGRHAVFRASGGGNAHAMQKLLCTAFE